MWTVPGGRLEIDDYITLPKGTKHYWYNVLEQVLRREVGEEVGIEIKNIKCVTSLAIAHGGWWSVSCCILQGVVRPGKDSVGVSSYHPVPLHPLLDMGHVLVHVIGFGADLGPHLPAANISGDSVDIDGNQGHWQHKGHNTYW